MPRLSRGQALVTSTGALGIILVASLFLWKPASAYAYSNRTGIVGYVCAYQSIGNGMEYVLGNDGNLWLENGRNINRCGSFPMAGDSKVYELFTSGTL